MKKQIFISLTVGIALLAACTSEKKSSPRQEQKYIYTEIMRDYKTPEAILIGEGKPGLWERPSDTIKALSPEEAYLQAYGRFTATMMFYTKHNEDTIVYTYPEKFTLTTPGGTDIIVNLDMPDRRKKEKEIWERHLSMEKRINKDDSIKLEKLEKARQVTF